jgi:hypothetical protein
MQDSIKMQQNAIPDLETPRDATPPQNATLTPCNAKLPSRLLQPCFSFPFPMMKKRLPMQDASNEKQRRAMLAR